MTERDGELEAAVRSLIGNGRSQAGPEPTVEELLAYHRGELSEPDAERFQERLIHHPDAVRLLAAFTGEEPRPGDPDYLSAADRDAALAELRQRLEMGVPRPIPAPPAEASGTSAPLAPPTAVPARVLARRRAAHWAERIAAVLALGVLGVSWHGRGERIERLDRQAAELREPQVLPEEQLIVPDARRRGPGAESAFALPPGARRHLLRFALQPVRPFPDYRLEIVAASDPEGGVLWSRSGLSRADDDTFVLYLPADSLPPGEYRFHLYGVDDGTNTPLATYTIGF